MSNKFILYKVLFNSNIALLIFSLDNLSIANSGDLTSLTLLVLLPIILPEFSCSPLNSFITLILNFYYV